MGPSEEVIDALEKEKAIITRGGMEAVRLIFAKLDKAADALAKEYDAIDFAREPEKAIRVQTFRRIVKVEIPAMLETIMNVDIPEDKPAWSFKRWISKAFDFFVTPFTGGKG